MPNASSAPRTSDRPGILLLEVYDALTAAITSALKKFAPSHQTHAADSLKKAETLAGKVEPELIILDVDPAWPKLTQTLVKWRDSVPSARVLVIGATIPQSVIGERGLTGALQFLKKPFDVAEFGAAVQALLGPWQQTATPRGTLESFGAADAALLQFASSRTARLEVAKNGSKEGEIHFKDGQIVHAETGKRTGVDALEEMFGWSEPDMREKERRGASPRTIETPWEDAFVDALGSAVRPRRQKRPVPVPKTPQPEIPAPPPPRERTGKKIVIVDDTEMLRIFVEDVLTTANPEFQITNAESGGAGVSEVERAQPDLVLLDFSLPDFNGDEVCKRLLENPETATIPVLMMSGHTPEMQRTAARYQNVVATVEKPFFSQALVELVEEILSAPEKFRRRISPPEDAPEPAPAPVEIAVEPPPPVRPEPVPVAEAEPAPPAPPPPDIVRPETKSPEPPAPPSMAPQMPSAQPMVASVSFPDPPVARAEPASEPPVAPVSPPRVSTPVTTKPAPAAAPRMGLAPDVSLAAETMPRRPTPTFSAPLVGSSVQEVVLGLVLEVISLQLTPSLRMGTIRARPSSQIASLLVTSRELQAALPPKGFQLGPVALDASRRIFAVKVVPTVQPLQPMEARPAFQIGGVSVVPENSHELLQLTSSANAPMRMQMLAKFVLAGVELSPTFQVSQLVLNRPHARVRVSLSAQEGDGTTCEISGVLLDGAGHIAELTLNAVS